VRACRSCGSRSTETPFPARGPRCTDCANERAAVPQDALDRNRIITRARYLAALRVRQRQAQTDLVDLVVPAPYGRASASRP
jgi:hypothetical protein